MRQEKLCGDEWRVKKELELSSLRSENERLKWELEQAKRLARQWEDTYKALRGYE